MKNKVVVLIILCTLFTLNMFSQDVSLPKYMYVTAERGLNAREAPGLSSNRILTFDFGTRIWATERGQADTIDGITDYWYRVLTNSSSYGWVFGGYLSDEPPVFIMDRVNYNIDLLQGDVDFSRIENYLGRWFLLDSEGNFCSSNSSFVIYIADGVYRFITNYYNSIQIGEISFDEWNNIQMIHSIDPITEYVHAWTIVGRPWRKGNTHVALIDNEGPLGFFERYVE